MQIEDSDNSKLMSFFVKSWLKFEEKIHSSVDLLQNTTSLIVELKEIVERNPKSDNLAACTCSKNGWNSWTKF